MITIATTGLEDYLEGGKGKIKVLLAGPPGAGKTRWASFAPRPIYAACEDGMMSVADRRVPYADVRSESDMKEFLYLLKTECAKPPAARRFDTAVIDTFDAWQRSVIQDYLKSKGGQRELDGFDDWGYLDSVMTWFVDAIMELPMHVIVLTHVKTKKGNDKLGVPDRIEPKLKGDIKVQLPSDFDFVGLFDNEFDNPGGEGMQLARRILWEPTPSCEWLKARGTAMRHTPVTFAPSDWESVRAGILAQIEAQGLQASEFIETVGSEPVVQQPLPPGPGGPVSTGVKAGPRPPAAQKPAQAQRPPQAPPQAPVAATPPPPAPRPVLPPATPATPEEAVGAVQEVLGGTVVADSAAPTLEALRASGRLQPASTIAPPALLDRESAGRQLFKAFAGTADGPVEPAPAAPSEGGVTTPVGTSDVVEPAVAAEPAVVPDEAEAFVTYCGAPRFTGGSPSSDHGCGQRMTVALSGGRITGAEDGQRADLMEIAGLRKRAFLHNACSTPRS